MGGHVSRKRDTSANTAETGAIAEEQTVKQPAQEEQTVKQPAQNSPQIQEADLEEETVTAVAAEKPVSASAPITGTESEPVVKDSLVEPEAVVSVSEPLPPEAEPVVAESPPAPEAEPVTEPEPAPEAVHVPEPEAVPVTEPEPAPEVEPVPEPEPGPEAEPVAEPVASPKVEQETVPKLEAEVETVVEAVSESAPAEAQTEQTGMIAQESVPESVISSPALIEVGIRDAIPQSVNTPPPPVIDEPSDTTLAECQGTAEVSTKSEDPSESMEAEVNLDQAVDDVKEENVSKLLENLELKEN